jgi:hypothetical protein
MIKADMRARSFLFPLGSLLCACACAQVIEFESGGLRYQTLSRNGVTVMYAHLPAQVRDYAVVQVAVSNGASTACSVRPEDFALHRDDGSPAIRAAAASKVVNEFLERASRDDVIKLVTTYEIGLYGISRIRSTNGYEKRRQAAVAELGSAKLKAAAAASAIALIETKLKPGESTDGAIFLPTSGRPVAGLRLAVTVSGQRFEFEPEP